MSCVVGSGVVSKFVCRILECDCVRLKMIVVLGVSGVEWVGVLCALYGVVAFVLVRGVAICDS